MPFQDYIPQEVADELTPRKWQKPDDATYANDVMSQRIPVLARLAVKTETVRTYDRRIYPPDPVKFTDWLSIREHAAPKNRIEETKGGIFIFSEFDEDFVNTLKTAVPPNARAWVGNAWFVSDDFAEQGRNIFELFYGDDGNVTPYY